MALHSAGKGKLLAVIGDEVSLISFISFNFVDQQFDDQRHYH